MMPLAAAVLSLLAGVGILLLLLVVMDAATRRWWRWDRERQRHLAVQERVAERALLDVDPDFARELGGDA